MPGTTALASTNRPSSLGAGGPAQSGGDRDPGCHSPLNSKVIAALLILKPPCETLMLPSSLVEAPLLSTGSTPPGTKVKALGSPWPTDVPSVKKVTGLPVSGSVSP